jgi:sulfatase maturation enzyme AslB (radical SAM superfamily)
MDSSFLSCCFIEGGLTFAPDGLYHCSLPLHGNAGWPFICEYDGKALPIDQILESRAQYRARYRRGENTVCEGCVYYLRHADWKAANPYLFNNLNIEHYTQCNLRCSYCCWLTTHPVKMGVNPYPLLPILKSIVDHKWMDPNGTIFWGGGEPSLLKEFEECMNFMLDCGIRNEISSNGTVFSRAICDNLPNPKVSLCVSVDAGRPETYQRMKAPGNKEGSFFVAVWNNLVEYCRSGGDVSVKYILLENNSTPEEIAAFVELVRTREIGRKIIVDVSHHLMRLDEKIIQAAAQMVEALRGIGIEPLLGIHGAPTLPREKFIERVTQHLSNFGSRSLTA